MSRVYDKTEDGRSYLYAIRCDGVGCAAEVRPHPEIASSGWMTHGVLTGSHQDFLEIQYCPDCEANRERRR